MEQLTPLLTPFHRHSSSSILHKRPWCHARPTAHATTNAVRTTRAKYLVFRFVADQEAVDHVAVLPRLHPVAVVSGGLTVATVLGQCGGHALVIGGAVCGRVTVLHLLRSRGGFSNTTERGKTPTATTKLYFRFSVFEEHKKKTQRESSTTLPSLFLCACRAGCFYSLRRRESGDEALAMCM